MRNATLPASLASFAGDLADGYCDSGGGTTLVVGVSDNN